MDKLEGTFYHQLDQKNRIRLPHKVKGGLGDKPYITLLSSGCLAVYPDEMWSEKVKLLDAVPTTDTEAFKRVVKIHSNTFLLEYDPQGRAFLPEKLRKLAKLAKDVVTVGMGKYVVIWDKSIFDGEIEEDETLADMSSLKGYGF